MDNIAISGDSLSASSGISDTSGMISSGMWGSEKVLSAELINGRIEIVKRQEANFTYCTYPTSTPPPRIWKEIYGISYYTKDDKGYGPEIVLLKTIDATWHSATNEWYEFKEEV